ncbi:hypothetical protein [Bacillus sp. CECT 9360]|uniref:hypothetical protein n=1 Tax=Bacillus sp. CECT 9360 TaxID=2845821 RepID=UPI001E341781|nr:hypothetical protein [Bacillus sp. CECT 9360]CAH0343992.1 hypothetical protein BCI9360_00220 [Bacillus sp. CECT 9360]
MDWLHWYDWITPTNPFASIFFGILLSVIVAFSLWFETREKKTLLIALFSGTLASVIFVVILSSVGFYQ